MCAHTHAHTYTYVYTHRHTRIHTHSHTHAHAHAPEHVRVHSVAGAPAGTAMARLPSVVDGAEALMLLSGEQTTPDVSIGDVAQQVSDGGAGPCVCALAGVCVSGNELWLVSVRLYVFMCMCVCACVLCC